jgi:radical SAM family uncharacterized protein/radical SAM-linked protein
MRHPYADIIGRVAKPARYLGGEYLSVKKDPAAVAASIVLAFPDVYDIGMSHMGTKILYSVLNKEPDLYAERAFAPWVDMENELRAHNLPLLSLETARPLSAFDVVGISLQYELTFSNVLTLLDLGGIPLYASERGTEAPLVLGGGPVATHPEPVAAFFDAFWIGDAEAELPNFVREWASARKTKSDRTAILAELAARYPIYAPALYETETCAETGMTVVGAPKYPGVPPRVRRGFVDNLDAYPFPGDTPVPYAEAVFDRAGVEIARGCTEGCRFCQAGMIYRPVRERSPDSVVESLLCGVNKAGYDETSLTSLSTADYSAITPLVKRVAAAVKEKKVSLSVSSLRAYGLNEEILDEMAAMRITGLTFAPEAGTQRMRDVVNKNVTEEHVETSTRRVFQRGWKRLKLYFMIGLPTEEDEDVRGIVDTGERMLDVGKAEVGARAEVTVSVSSHVPKPHTPFQWCRQDPTDEITRKQRLLRGTVRRRALRLKMHDSGISFVEGVFARGDRRLAKALLMAWRRGARFDGWEEQFDLDRWHEVFRDTGIDTASYLDTRPVSARLPWDHIDVGLEDGFLLAEYRRALKNRLSPPCGKVKGRLIHHTNLKDARADQGKLVCYDCGVACDLSRMRAERIEYLEALGAHEPLPPRERPVIDHKVRPTPQVAFAEKATTRFRVRYAKLDRAAFLGHLDMTRVLARMFRRADVEVAYSRGFHPQPQMAFAPALALGIPALAELFDVSIETEISAPDLLERLREVAPAGLVVTGVEALLPSAPKLSRLIQSYSLGLQPTRGPLVEFSDRIHAFMDAREVWVTRKERPLNVRPLVSRARVLSTDEAGEFATLLSWPRRPMAILNVCAGNQGSAKPSELVTGIGLESPFLARLGFSIHGAPPLA